MKGIVIFGAGQAGMAMYRLLQRRGSRVIAFGDNNRSLWGQEREGLPVWSLSQVMEAKPELICLAIVNQEAADSILNELRQSGYEGEIITVGQLKKQFDIRLATVRLLAEEIRRRDIQGAIAELGVYQGDFAAELNRMFPDRPLYLFDTFSGFDERDLCDNKNGTRAETGEFSDTSAELVMGKMQHPDRVIVKQGYFPDSLGDFSDTFALVSLDADLYQPTYAGLEFFYTRLAIGGYIILDDYNSPQFPGAGQAVRDFCDRKGLSAVPLCDLHGTAVLAKSGGAV